MIKLKGVHKKIAIRVFLILIIYLIILFISQFFVNSLYNRIDSEIYSESLVIIEPFLDDFVTAKFSCQGNKTDANFLVIDEFGNVRHNSSATLDCNTFTRVSLQGSPLDFTKDRRYIVYVSFNNQTINSGYFEFENVSGLKTFWREIESWFAFMINQNKLARGTYSDKQRLLFADTGDFKYAQKALFANVIGLYYAFTIFLGIDVAIWVFVWIKSTFKSAYRKKRRV